MNVIDSDATLIVYIENMDTGTLTTKDFAFEHRKPLFIWKIGKINNVLQFLKWFHNNQVRVLNIAGPKASNTPDIYGETLEVLNVLLSNFVQMADKRNY